MPGRKARRDMSKPRSWKLVFYREKGETAPFTRFLLGLPHEDQRCIEASMSILKRLNVHARPPLVRRVKGKLWELCVSTGKKRYRLFYVLGAHRRIIFLHGFLEKTRRHS